MVVFSEGGYNPMDRGYSSSSDSSTDFDSAPQMSIEQPISPEERPITIA